METNGEARRKREELEAAKFELQKMKQRIADKQDYYMEAFEPIRTTIKKWESVPTPLMQRSVKALWDVLKPAREEADRDIAMDIKYRDVLKAKIELMEEELKD